MNLGSVEGKKQVEGDNVKKTSISSKKIVASNEELLKHKKTTKQIKTPVWGKINY